MAHGVRNEVRALGTDIAEESVRLHKVKGEQLTDLIQLLKSKHLPHALKVKYLICKSWVYYEKYAVVSRYSKLG